MATAAKVIAKAIDFAFIGSPDESSSTVHNLRLGSSVPTPQAEFTQSVALDKLLCNYEHKETHASAMIRVCWGSRRPNYRRMVGEN